MRSGTRAKQAKTFLKGPTAGALLGMELVKALPMAQTAKLMPKATVQKMIPERPLRRLGPRPGLREYMVLPFVAEG